MRLKRIANFIYFNIVVKYYRKRKILELLYINKYAESYYCNVCGKLVLKGIIKDVLMLNCPHCNSVFHLLKDNDNHIYKSTHSNIHYKIQEKDMIDTGIRCSEYIMGVKITIREGFHSNGKNNN